MPLIFNRQPLRRQVIVTAILLVLPLVLVVIWSAGRAASEREVDLRGEAASVAATSAAYLNEYLDSLDSLGFALGRHQAVRSQRREECDRLFAEVLAEQPLLLNIVLTGRDGALKGTGIPLAPDGKDNGPTSSAYLGGVLASGEPMVGELMAGGPDRTPMPVLAYPVLADDRGVVAVLAFSVNLARVQTQLASTPLPDGSVMTLIDDKDQLLTRSEAAERIAGKMTTSEGVLRDRAAAVTSTGIDGVRRVFGSRAINRAPWRLTVGIPTSVALERALPMWRRSLSITLAWTLASFAAALFLADRVVRPMNHLKRVASRIASGDLSAPETMDPPALEFAQLQDAIITMAANLRQMRDVLDEQVEQERRMREVLQSLQRQVLRQERLAAVGLLVSGVAHELNNPLQAILGTAELLENSHGLSAEALEEIALLKTQSSHAREIIRNLSRFGSQQPGPPSRVDLRDVIGEVVQLRQRALGNSGVVLEIETTATRNVFANFTELEQVVLNFVINAAQAIEASERPQGRILIRLYDVGRRVRLEVIDDGSGVRPEDEPKLFQPFFTTKPAGVGTGLGLSVSYGIIDSCGGTIGHSGNEWNGATFFFELQAVDGPESGRDEISAWRGVAG